MKSFDTINWEKADESRLAVAASMNKRLIEDDKSRNPMSVPELERRMRHWLSEGWSIELPMVSGEIAGYAVYRIRPDEYEPDRSYIYLRQFYIERDRRGRGLGVAAFRLLRESRFPEGAILAIDVLEANPGGRRFWAKVGFRPYSTSMHMTTQGVLGPHPLHRLAQANVYRST